MKKENLYLIHGEDYLRHIEEKLELLWMATILMHYIKNGAEKDGYLDLVRRSTLDFDERCEEMFSSWGRALNYLKSHDLADLSDLIENDLIEPEYAGYVPADKPCCPGERCCEYAECGMSSMPSRAVTYMRASRRRSPTMSLRNALRMAPSPTCWRAMR